MSEYNEAIAAVARAHLPAVMSNNASLSAREATRLSTEAVEMLMMELPRRVYELQMAEALRHKG